MAFLFETCPHISSPVIITAILISYYVVSSVASWWRLRAFDGPFATSFSYMWLYRCLSGGQQFTHLLAAGEKYGVTIRVGPNDLLTADPEVLRRMGSARSSYARSNFYALSRLYPDEESMFTLMDTAEHDKLKAKTAAGYSGKDVPGLEADIDSVIAELVDKIHAKYAVDPAAGPAEAQKPRPLLDFAVIAQYFTLDAISQVAWGERLGFLRTESDLYGHLAMLHDLVTVMNVAAGIPYLAFIASLRWVQTMAAPKGKNARGIYKILPITGATVAKRFAPNAQPQPDMLGSFIRHGLTQSQCQTEAIFQIIAGSDTTATAVRATLLHIITAPRVYFALQREIDAAIALGKISSPIAHYEAIQLPYLQAVIYEGLRIWPPFNGVPFKLVPPTGDTIDGKFVPGGTRIAPNTPALNRSRSLFGDDADEFRPARWIEADSEKVAEMKRVVELVFGYGRWMCAGKHVAFLELNKVFVELLRRFDFQIANPTKPWDGVNLTLWLQWNMWVRVTLRKNMAGGL